VTVEQLQRIRHQWLSSRYSAAQCTVAEMESAISDIARLLEEVERLHHCCDEITRQYARLSLKLSQAADENGSQLPRSAA
jgi:hypothetical protein